MNLGAYGHTIMPYFNNAFKNEPLGNVQNVFKIDLGEIILTSPEKNKYLSIQKAALEMDTWLNFNGR